MKYSARWRRRRRGWLGGHYHTVDHEVVEPKDRTVNVRISLDLDHELVVVWGESSLLKEFYSINRFIAVWCAKIEINKFSIDVVMSVGHPVGRPNDPEDLNPRSC